LRVPDLKTVCIGFVSDARFINSAFRIDLQQIPRQSTNEEKEIFIARISQHKRGFEQSQNE
jgi:hypothetical protein